MSRKLLLLFILATAGCSIGKVPTDNLTLLSNNSLCRALGENADNGDITFRILNEIASREGSIDTEECHSIEVFAKNQTSFGLMNSWPNRGIDKMNDQITRDIQKMVVDGKL
ncbi:hypothetical protein HZS38_08755 [Xenorhabdus nematophila]|uniref:hypothetical protein n=1 Tax=Xenorhabdus nematophila TaxID=628 RepID=UPI0005443836|nr:hypothetical protein [Xenorhabdus nematophila]CEF32419.1 hypothetical protein; putative exported protein [Xenorhabdus nematophila str. Websteri]AYA40496.1 hypothetical protein D3790_08600 [Xenorhabdus nematophila]KHD27787.1 hypothetical protein LH67_15220 [Xenorhabdus nematophila]MBA0019233.1 hypothetical protein [Xenorhabdus nematophila]MCB4425532.1 hypothetical protein [Xenorhabdus nematophila]